MPLYVVSAAAVETPFGLGPLLDRRLLLFTGKGGVGKSTVVAALAVEAASRGKRPLIVELGHRASMRTIFAAPELGHAPRPVGEGREIWAANLDFEEALVDYVVEHARFLGRSAARTITGNRALHGLFRAAPAVRETVMLNKLRLFERHETRGRPTWGPILVDLDATGHALMLLDMPQILDGLLADGPLRGLVEVLTGLFTDPARTLLNLVTLPAEVPVQETLELYARLDRGRGVQLGAVFVNQVPRPPLRRELRPLLPGLARLAADAGLRALACDLELAARALAQEAQVRELVVRLRDALRVPLSLLPRLDVHGRGIPALQTLGRAAMRELPRLDASDPIRTLAAEDE